MKRAIAFLVYGLIQIGNLGASLYCRNKSYKRERLRCDDRCCGTWPYQTCCEDEEEEGSWYGWAVVGVIGGVIAVLLIISLSICGVCLLIKFRGKKGRAIQPFRDQDNVPPVYTPTTSQLTPYPLGQDHVTTIIQNSSTVPELPPAYHSLYGHQQHYGQHEQRQERQQQQTILLQQRLPPITSSLQGHGHTQMT